MSKVLIFGAGSYLGMQLEKSLTADGFDVETIDAHKPLSEEDFTGAQAVIQVAGIAHQRETEENKALYFSVNRDLAAEVAKLAKAAGVGQFVFFSSMSVYGLTCGHITAQTMPAPETAYGQSKWEAEQLLNKLADDRFRVAVLRPPMIYGKGCKGNYPRLRELILKMPLFPRVGNQRSMLYVGCLCSFMRRLLESGQGGLYFPQNKEYVSTDALAAEIAKAHRKKLWQPGCFAGGLRLLSGKAGTLGKVFGSLTYAKELSTAFGDEPQPDFAQTIRETEA